MRVGCRKPPGGFCRPAPIAPSPVFKLTFHPNRPVEPVIHDADLVVGGWAAAHSCRTPSRIERNQS